MIELRHLRYFVVVAEELHFGRAAERLHMAQSPLSHQIRQLERELGVELLERGHHVIGLTDAGRAMLKASRALLDDLDQAVKRTRRASRGEVGTICIGYVAEVTSDLLPVSLNVYKSTYPDVAIDLLHGSTGLLVEALRRHDVDVAFVRTPGHPEDVEYEQLIEESLFAAYLLGIPSRRNNRTWHAWRANLSSCPATRQPRVCVATSTAPALTPASLRAWQGRRARSPRCCSWSPPAWASP